MTDAMTTVGAVLRHQVNERGDTTMVVCDDDRLTYAEAEARSRAIGRGLVARGASRGTHVGILFPTGLDFVVTWLAATRIGAVAVPISTFSTADELRGLLADADIDVLVTIDGYRGHDYVDRLHEAVGADLSHAGEFHLASAPALRQVFVAGTPDGVHPDHTVDFPRRGGCVGRRWALRRHRGRRVTRRSHGDRLHVGFDERAQGRDPSARAAHPPRRQPQRAARPARRA